VRPNAPSAISGWAVQVLSWSVMQDFCEIIALRVARFACLIAH
jgi:hypothetical protein